MTADSFINFSAERENCASRTVSIVVPAFNECRSVKPLYLEIAHVAAAHQLAIELILVDDGSTDGTWEQIEQIATEDSRVCGIRMRRRFGKTNALAAGFAAAAGDYIATLDADLQDDPSELPAMIQKLERGFDLVNGWKRRRLDPWNKIVPSKVFNWLVNNTTGLRLHDHNCGIKLMRREVANELPLYGEMHRFIPVLADQRGFRVTEQVVHHRPRRFDRTKFGTERFMRGFLDLLNVSFCGRYGRTPHHLLGRIALMLGSFGAISGIIGGSLAVSYRSSTWWACSLIIMSVCIVHATSILCMGLLAELLMREQLSMSKELSHAANSTLNKHAIAYISSRDFHNSDGESTRRRAA